jgi:hypothetical protein
VSALGAVDDGAHLVGDEPLPGLGGHIAEGGVVGETHPRVGVEGLNGGRASDVADHDVARQQGRDRRDRVEGPVRELRPAGTEDHLPLTLDETVSSDRVEPPPGDSGNSGAVHKRHCSSFVQGWRTLICLINPIWSATG